MKEVVVCTCMRAYQQSGSLLFDGNLEFLAVRTSSFSGLAIEGFALVY